MRRVSVLSAVLLTVISLGTFPTLAQSTSAKPKYPGEIAAASRLLTEKTADCRRQAREQQLTFFKRRRFVQACIKDEK